MDMSEFVLIKPGVFKKKALKAVSKTLNSFAEETLAKIRANPKAKLVLVKVGKKPKRKNLQKRTK